jgi:ribosomal protein L11 methyltransferase
VRAAARRERRDALRLDAYFPSSADRNAVAALLRETLAAAGVEGPAPDLRAVRDRAWVEIWQRTLRPMRIGRRFLVVPEGRSFAPVRGRLPIIVRFGQAFGTGEHASTRMSLRLLERIVRPDDAVVDLGTGTGILAMAAALLGAGEVVGFDDDPVALRVARANLHANRLSGRVALVEGDAGVALGEPDRFDLALINIGATVIGRVLPGVARALRPGGRAVLSGILIEDERPLLGLARRCGLTRADRCRERPWSALLLRRPAGRDGRRA